MTLSLLQRSLCLIAYLGARQASCFWLSPIRWRTALPARCRRREEAATSATSQTQYDCRATVECCLCATQSSDSQDKVNQEGPSLASSTAATTGKSRVLSIISYNLAGAVSHDNDREAIQISLDPSQPFVACTGETGSGKSLLLARALELIAGGKVSDTLVGGVKGSDILTASDGEPTTAFVEMQLWVEEPHLSFVRSILSTAGVTDVLHSSGLQQAQKLIIRRTLLRMPAPSSSGRRKTRLKSLCTVNGKSITLKALSSLTSPLLVVVDASAAASALARPEARLSILDTGVDPAVRQYFGAAQRAYRQCRQVRQGLEDDLASRLLPQSFSMDTEEDIKLVDHWISEMDALRARVGELTERLSPEEMGDYGSLGEVMRQLQETDWMENSSERGQPFASALYERLKTLRDTLRSLDNQIMSASNAAAVLSSLSFVESAATALEKSRNLLFEAMEGGILSQRLEDASETSHDLLNQAEMALAKCARFIEDEDKGLLATLENLRGCCPVSVDTIDELILDWNSIARKHNISPFTLPSCYKSMINERDGNVESLSRLPKAVAAEKEALEKFKSACELLARERKRVAEVVQREVNRRLPSLGMSSSDFVIALTSEVRECTDSSAYTGNLGWDSVEFILRHGTTTDEKENAIPRRGGPIQEVASSGEKARILLAIECSLPGSIRVATGASSTTVGTNLLPSVPISVVYDEIDAHVGGRAAVALGHMLADQSRQTQVIAITHSPAVAASADAHIVVQKTLSGDRTLIRVESRTEVERRKELARMASGDIAADEAELFAEALIRDGKIRRNQQQT